MKKNKPTSVIPAAQRLFRAKKFSEVIRMLEPEIFRFRESLLFYKLLGLSCVHTGDLGGGASYLTRALQIEDDDVDARLGLAVISLRKMKTDEAIRIWLEVLEIDSKNRQAKKGLLLIRKTLEPERLAEFIESKRIVDVYPGRKHSILVPVLVSIAIALVLFTVPLIIVRSGIFERSESSRIEFEEFKLPGNISSLIEYKDDARYSYTENDVREIFTRAKKFFLAYRDNPACIELNRLLNSNAVAEIKSLSSAMKERRLKPTFATMKDNITLKDVLVSPFLYADCYAVWRGRVGSLLIGKIRITFHLWVGNDKEFEGVVPCIIEFPYELKNNQEIEVLGEIKLEKDRFFIQGKTIHEIVK